MKILKAFSTFRPTIFLSLLLVALSSLSVISCSKSDGEDEEDNGEELTKITYRLIESSRLLMPNILEVGYTNEKGEMVKTDYTGFLPEKSVRVKKPFDATLVVKAQNTSSTEQAQILLQILVDLDPVDAVELALEPNTTMTQQVKHNLR